MVCKEGLTGIFKAQQPQQEFVLAAEIICKQMCEWEKPTTGLTRISGIWLRFCLNTCLLHQLSAVQWTMAKFKSLTHYKPSVLQQRQLSRSRCTNQCINKLEVPPRDASQPFYYSHPDLTRLDQWGSVPCPPPTPRALSVPFVDKQDNFNLRCVWRKRRGEPTSYVARVVSGWGPVLLAQGVLGKPLVR